MSAPDTSPLGALRAAVAEWLAASDEAAKEAEVRLSWATERRASVTERRASRTREALVVEAVKLANGPDLVLAPASVPASTASSACPDFNGHVCEVEGHHIEHFTYVDGYGPVTWTDATADAPMPPRVR